MANPVNRWHYQGNIHSNYNGKQMTLGKKEEVDFKTCPLGLTQAQFDAVPERDRVFDILAENAMSPIAALELPCAASPLIGDIDSTFEEAMLDYKKAFVEAFETDNRARKADAAAPPDWFANSCFRYYGPLERFLAIFRENNPQNYNAARHAWMISVGTKEEMRLREAAVKVMRRSEVLLENLENEKREGYVNNEQLEELTVLNHLFVSMNQRELIIKEIKIQDFINIFNVEEKHER